MFTLEEYILKRKKEDGLNELDAEKRTENTRICVNYVFEYFNNYLETKAADKKTVLHEQKVDKYRHIIRDYDDDIQDWLLSLYSSYGKYMHRNLANYIDDTYFLLYDIEAEFRALSYEIYPKVIKKFKFLNGQSENLCLFIKDKHRVNNLFSDYDNYQVCESIDEWIKDTYQRHGVNLYNFCCEWVRYFYDNPDIWPVSYKKRSEYYKDYHERTDVRYYKFMLWDYDYKQKSNLFNLNSLYRDMPKKTFIRGRKQEFEILLMYCWLHEVHTDEDYWNTYLNGKL